MNDGVYTAIDACINRAIEGLRVCEDIFRFALHDKASSLFKELRHSIRDAASVFPASRLLNARDIGSDSQKFIDTAGERERSGLAGVFRANIRRSAEAVRSLEELSKIIDPHAGALFQSIRFRIYEIEKQCWFILHREELALRVVNRHCLIIESGTAHDMHGVAAETARLGAAGIVLRLNSGPDNLDLEAARKLSSICADCSLMFLVFGRPDIAALAGADGLCLEHDGFRPGDARRIAGEGILVGIPAAESPYCGQGLGDEPDFTFSVIDERKINITPVVKKELPG